MPCRADDPLTVVEDIASQFKPLELPELPRFAGGFVGYLSYDVVRAFEKLPHRKKPGLDVPDVLLMLFDSILIFDNLKQTLSILTNVHTGGEILYKGAPLFPSGRRKTLRPVSRSRQKDRQNRCSASEELHHESAARNAAGFGSSGPSGSNFLLLELQKRWTSRQQSRNQKNIFMRATFFS